MAARTALFASPTTAVFVAVPLLNQLQASAGIAAATLGLIAVAGGSAMGYFADHLPAVPFRAPFSS